MPRPARRPRTILSVLLASLLLIAAASPALAKEGMQARLDAPVGRATPGGTVLTVGLRVTVLSTAGRDPVDGSPVYLVLWGPGGSTRATLVDTGPTPGHYTMRIVVPAGGVSIVEVGLHGTSDMPIDVVEPSLVAGGISATTAQVAPALAASAAPSAASAAPAAVLVAPPPAAAVPTAVAVDPQPAGLLPVLVGGFIVLAIAGVLLALAIRRARSGDRVMVPGRTPGA